MMSDDPLLVVGKHFSRIWPWVVVRLNTNLGTPAFWILNEFT